MKSTKRIYIKIIAAGLFLLAAANYALNPIVQSAMLADDPTGVCCIVDQCLGVGFTEDECDCEGGDWYEDEDCDDCLTHGGPDPPM